MTRHESQGAIAEGAARQAIAGLDAGYVEKTTDAIVALQGLELPNAFALRTHLLEVLSLLLTIQDDKTPNASLIAAMDEARTLKGRFRTAEELFHALETDGRK